MINTEREYLQTHLLLAQFQISLYEIKEDVELQPALREIYVNATQSQIDILRAEIQAWDESQEAIALDDPAVKQKVGTKGSDICPEHHVHESCALVSHTHTFDTCYRVFEFECGHLSVLSQSTLHCSDGDTVEEEMGHALFHIVNCKDTVLCPDCRGLAEAAIKSSEAEYQKC